MLARSETLTVGRVHLPHGFPEADAVRVQRQYLDETIAERRLSLCLAWYYSPMALAFSEHLTPEVTVYDCMDELSLFKGAHPDLTRRESQLLTRADLVFTGGYSLYEAKRQSHRDIHPFPSSVDAGHFARARKLSGSPPDQAAIPHPRIGFCGVIDERLDQPLLAAIAEARPDWQFVMIGPVVKIDPAELPRRPNIHYLGPKDYAELPAYMAGWDAAMMPFAINPSTRFISPTKTPEYLAAGLPVVSTRITDVVRHYGSLPGVGIAATPADFVTAIDKALAQAADPATWRDQVDRHLAEMSWDWTWSRMSGLIDAKREARAVPAERRASPVDAARARPAAPHLRRRAGFDYLIVGAGFAGSVLAERLAADAGRRVLLVDRRPHVGGNAYDHYDQAGLLVHRYGPHIFHTNADRVAGYLSNFTEWRPYEHRVLARIDEKLLPVPINRTTVNGFFGLDLAEAEVEQFLKGQAEPLAAIRNSEDVVVSQVGRALYEAFFRGYTRKQWGVEPADLDKSVTSRIPVRSNDDDRYFTDSFQAMPRLGYTRMFENMLDHPNITLMLQADFRDVADEIDYRHLIFTGPIDEFFDYRFGPLPYRSLVFEHRTLDQPSFQPVGVVNYPSPEVGFTRVTEYKHLTGQIHRQTSISYEYASGEGDPYYPVPRPENTALYARYQELADQTPGVSFVGRLATYRYYNMDQVVAQALKLYERLEEQRPVQSGRRTAMADGAPMAGFGK